MQRAADTVSSRHSHLNLLINVSGVLQVPGILSPETSLSRVTMDNLLLSYKTNAFGPILCAKAFTPLLMKAASEGGATE